MQSRLFAMFVMAFYPLASLFSQSEFLDPAFGQNGRQLLHFLPSDDQGFAVQQRPNGRILVAGRAVIDSFNQFVLTQYLPDGRLDPEFDIDGKQSINFGTGQEIAYAATLLPDGRSLTEVAAELPGGGFDRDLVHSVLAGIPKGRWTTYGDLADAVGTGAQALSQHIAKCPDCPNFIRVVGKGGAPSDGFKWSDPNDVRTQRQALEAEGVAFPDGVADPAARMTVNELDLLADNG